MTPPTYQELRDALRVIRDGCFFGSTGYYHLTKQAYDEATALLARAESAKLVGTYVWHDVREGLPDKCGWYVCAMEADEEVSELYFRDGGFPQATAYWAEPLQHPSDLEGSTK